MKMQRIPESPFLCEMELYVFLVALETIKCGMNHKVFIFERVKKNFFHVGVIHELPLHIRNTFITVDFVIRVNSNKGLKPLVSKDCVNFRGTANNC